MVKLYLFVRYCSIVFQSDCASLHTCQQHGRAPVALHPPYCSVSWISAIPVQGRVLALSGVQLSATPWTIEHHALLFKGFSRQKYWSGRSFPSPGDLSNPGIETKSPALQADS